MGVSGWMFLLVPAYPGSPRQKAVKRLCVCVCVWNLTSSQILAVAHQVSTNWTNFQKIPGENVLKFQYMCLQMEMSGNYNKTVQTPYQMAVLIISQFYRVKGMSCASWQFLDEIANTWDHSGTDYPVKVTIRRNIHRLSNINAFSTTTLQLMF